MRPSRPTPPPAVLPVPTCPPPPSPPRDPPVPIRPIRAIDPSPITRAAGLEPRVSPIGGNATKGTKLGVAIWSWGAGVGGHLWARVSLWPFSLRQDPRFPPARPPPPPGPPQRYGDGAGSRGEERTPRLLPGGCCGAAGRLPQTPVADGGGGGKLGILGGGRGAEAGAMRGGGGAEGGERGWGSRVGGRGGNGAQRGGGAAVRCRDKGHPLPPPPSVSLWGGTRGGPQRVGGRGPPGGDGAQWRRWAAVGCGETGRPRLLLGVRRDGDGDGDGGRPTNTGGGGKTFLLGGSGALNPGKPLVWESASSAALRSAAASAAPPGLTFLS